MKMGTGGVAHAPPARVRYRWDEKNVSEGKDRGPIALMLISN